MCNILFVDVGDDEVFKKLHSHFTWMLKAGALTYSETLYTSHDLLKKLNPQLVKNSIFDAKACEVQNEECIDLRALENMLTRSVFRILLYCTLTGINVSHFYHHALFKSKKIYLSSLCFSEKYDACNVTFYFSDISNTNGRSQYYCQGTE